VSFLVVIGQADQVPALRKRLGADPAVTVFADTDSLQALEAILGTRPKIVALSANFATTGRGAGLVARLKNDADLSGIDLRILLEDENQVPLLLADSPGSSESALVDGSRPLSRAGTRGALRYVMDRRAITVNGERGALIDLSATGAQVLAAARLRPNEPLRLVLPDDAGDMRLAGTVVWSVAMPVGGSIEYRAGAKFGNPDGAWLESYCVRLGGRPDFTFGAE
jgi:hypothetical protein